MEIWKSHPEYKAIEVSTLGRVRTLDRVVSSEIGTYFTDGHILKQYDNTHGYLNVCIPVDGKWTTKKVHRLVAQAFLPNTDDLPQVNHRDCDRANNNVDNLEWCTRSYNMKYREKYGISQTEPVGHLLFAVNLTTLEVSRFPSQKEASRELGIFQPNINAVIKGRYKYTHGFWFTNADDKADDAINHKLQTLAEHALRG